MYAHIYTVQYIMYTLCLYEVKKCMHACIQVINNVNRGAVKVLDAGVFYEIWVFLVYFNKFFTQYDF